MELKKTQKKNELLEIVNQGKGELVDHQLTLNISSGTSDSAIEITTRDALKPLELHLVLNHLNTTNRFPIGVGRDGMDHNHHQSKIVIEVGRDSLDHNHHQSKILIEVGRDSLDHNNISNAIHLYSNGEGHSNISNLHIPNDVGLDQNTYLISQGISPYGWPEYIWSSDGYHGY